MLQAVKSVAGEEVIAGDLNIIVGVDVGDDGHRDHGIPFLQKSKGRGKVEV